jgi:hypothetical protein
VICVIYLRSIRKILKLSIWILIGGRLRVEKLAERLIKINIPNYIWIFMRKIFLLI